MSADDSLVRTLVIVVAALVLVPFLLMVLVMPMMGLWGWGHVGGAGMWDGTGVTWMWLLVSVVPVLVLLGVGYLLYSLIRHSSGRQSDAALEELRIAYARGDISDEEFEQRRERLNRDQEVNR